MKSISQQEEAKRITGPWVAAAEAYEAKGKHIITSKIEHHAILHTCGISGKRGYEVTYLDVDENGVVKLDELKKAIPPGYHSYFYHVCKQ